MGYQQPPAYARKDLLTPGNYNQLLLNARALERALRLEHKENGEHNSPLITRTVGTVRLAAGPVYSLGGFDGDVTLGPGYNPQVGHLLLTLAGNRYRPNAAPILVQNASVTGASLPCLSSAKWVLDPNNIVSLTVPSLYATLEVFSTYWNGTLGVPGSGNWALVAYGGGQDAQLHLAVHGPLLTTGSLLDFGGPLQSRQGLRAEETDRYANQLIQGSADLEAALRVAHTAGVHDARTIPKAWAHVQWNGSRYVIVDQECSPTFDGGYIASVENIGTGIAEVVFASNMATQFYQVFVDVDYPRLYGEAADYFIANVPEQYQLQQAFQLYFYERLLTGGGVEYFDRNGAVDFHLWIYDDHGA